MEEIELEEGETIKIIEFESILIEEKENKYNLEMKENYIENNITLSINDKNQFPTVCYIQTMNLKEIKDIDKSFNTFKTFNDFYDYLKVLSDQKKLKIQKEKNKLIIKNENIKIELVAVKKNLESKFMELYEELKNIRENEKEIDILKKENIELKNRIEILEKENQKNNQNCQPKDELNILSKDITINFIIYAHGQKIDYSMNCCNLEVLPSIKEKLCLKFDYLKNKEILFFSHGNNLKHNLTLEQNEIKDGDIIIIYINK